MDTLLVTSEAMIAEKPKQEAARAFPPGAGMDFWRGWKTRELASKGGLPIAAYAYAAASISLIVAMTRA
ncbi:hypothetical protein ASE23_23155 [Rhizobium sp. Root73]|nr:hypothetical protein ASD36_22560 [Rhizobium sp. Root1334]KRC11364.1 hypothetical protein ASE23_23155 [Rhizobium sp. Root73]